MEPVKEERVSPLLQEPTFISSDNGSAIPPEDYKDNNKMYHEQSDRTPSPPSTASNTTISLQQIRPPNNSMAVNKHSILPSPTDLVCGNYKSLIESTTSSLLSSTSEIEITPTGVQSSHRSKNGMRVLDGKDPLVKMGQHADISDAVSKILEDYDWSQIPLANSDRRKVHVKRPMNAFMVWAQEARKKLSGQHRQVHNAELSKSLGRIWRGMSDDQKKPFIDRAEQLRKKHKQEYPDYKYQPRRRKENIKTVSGAPGGSKSPSSTASCVSVQDLTTAHAFASMKGLAMHPLSPPHSPAPTHPSARCHDGHPSMQEAVFVGECISADSFDGIDRAEMNKYLLPDQGMAAYIHGSHPSSIPSNPPPCSSAGSHMSVAMGSVSPVLNGSCVAITAASANPSNVAPGNAMSPGHSVPGSCSSNPLPPLQSITHSRLMPPASAYSSGNASPYYSSQETTVSGSPDLGLGNEVIAGTGSPVGSGGSPDSPVEYVELQPPRVPKDESPLGNLKSPVNHFLPQNLCYSQHYPYNYPYAYSVWHG